MCDGPYDSNFKHQTFTGTQWKSRPVRNQIIIESVVEHVEWETAQKDRGRRKGRNKPADNLESFRLQLGALPTCPTAS